jgi:integrase
MPVHITQAHASKVNQPCRIYDTHRGLHLWVKSEKAKYWIYRNAKDGKRTDISLGSFPRIGVAEARRKAGELADQIGHGETPVKRRGEIAAAKEAVKQAITFSDFAKHIVESKQPEWKNAKHAQQWSNTLEQYAFPLIGQKALADIITDDILQILMPIWQTKTETATRLRGRIERVLAAATIKGLRQGVNPAQWRGHLDCLLPQAKKLKKVKHHPAMPYQEIPQFIELLQGRDGIAALALEFCILTAARTSEVLLARRSEIAGDVWTVPEERMKAGKEHKVPLCSRTNQLITKAIELDADSEYVFSKMGKPLSNMALLALLKRMGRDDVTTHGFRSTFRDWVSEETEHRPEVAEMALAHTIANRVEAAYRRGDLLEKRRLLLKDWEIYCVVQC